MCGCSVQILTVVQYTLGPAQVKFGYNEQLAESSGFYQEPKTNVVIVKKTIVYCTNSHGNLLCCILIVTSPADPGWRWPDPGKVGECIYI